MKLEKFSIAAGIVLILLLAVLCFDPAHPVMVHGQKGNALILKNDPFHPFGHIGVAAALSKEISVRHALSGEIDGISTVRFVRVIEKHGTDIFVYSLGNLPPILNILPFSGVLFKPSLISLSLM